MSSPEPVADVWSASPVGHVERLHADGHAATDPLPKPRAALTAQSENVDSAGLTPGDETSVAAPAQFTLARISDAAPLFPPTDVPLREGLPHAQPDPVTRLRRVLSVGDLLLAGSAVAVCVGMSRGGAAGAIAVTLLLVSLLSANDREHPSRLLNAWCAAKRSMVAVGLVCTAQVMFAWSDSVSVRPIIKVMILLGSLVVAWRLLLKLPAVQRLFGSERYESAILVGDFPTVSTTIRRWRARKAATRIAGVLLTDAPDGIERRTDAEGVPVLGQLRDTAPVACALGVSKVVVVGETVHSTTLRRIGWELDRYGIPVAVAMRIEGIRPHRSRVDIVGDQTVVELEAVRRRGVVNLAWTLTDRLLALILLVVAMPALVLIAVAVRMDSPGPALFKQARAGRFGKPFIMWKFRSMATDAESQKGQLADLNESDGVFFKIRKDPRITRIGTFLRSTSIDELPQLWNVVRGDMSLVGPRPHVIAEANAYDAWAQRRLMVKPGLTGLWQINGRSNLGWDEAVLHDLDYVDNWRPGLDLGIVLRTLGAVLKRDGAY